MATTRRIRIVSLGTTEEMTRLCRTMLRNCDFDGEFVQAAEWDLMTIYEKLKQHARQECGNENAFEYEMIAPSAYGTALPDGSFMLQQAEEDLWTAEFRYESVSPMQAEDWLRLHISAGRIPMFAIYAAEDFGLQKGGVRFCAGRCEETWSQMAEGWLWLWHEYGCGMEQKELLAFLKKVRKKLDRQDWDQMIPQLLASCAENLRQAQVGCLINGQMLRERLACQDFAGLYVGQVAIAESLLWQGRDAERYLAWLQQAREIWIDAYGEEVAD